MYDFLYHYVKREKYGEKIKMGYMYTDGIMA